MFSVYKEITDNQQSYSDECTSTSKEDTVYVNDFYWWIKNGNNPFSHFFVQNIAYEVIEIDTHVSTHKNWHKVMINRYLYIILCKTNGNSKQTYLIYQVPYNTINKARPQLATFHTNTI